MTKPPDQERPSSSPDVAVDVERVTEGASVIGRAEQVHLHVPVPPTARRGGVFGAMRRPSQAFTGREDDLARVQALLTAEQPVAISASIEGLAGIGKTELAVHLVHRLDHEGAFPGGIYWLDAEERDLTVQWGTAIAGQQGKTGASVHELAEQVLSELGRTPTLVVLDNVTSWTKEMRPGPLPRGAHVRLLVTTRRSHLGGNAFKHVGLEVLGPEASRKLLEDTADRGSLPDTEALLEHLDGHALALELAGAHLAAHRRETPDSYLARLRAKGGSEVEGKVASQTRYEKTVDQALATAWDGLNRPSQDALRIAAQFEDDWASYELAAACGLDGDILDDLTRMHLVRPDIDGTRWTMHRLVRAFGRRQGTAAEQEEAERQFVVGCVAISDRIDHVIGFRVYVPDKAHFDAVAEKAESAFEEEGARSKLLNGLGMAHKSLGDYTQAKGLMELALAVDLETFGPDHPNVALWRSNLATVLQDLGDFEGAKGLMEQALAVALEAFGPDHPNVATRRSNLAGALQSLGDLEGAKRLMEQALASDQAAFGPDHRNVAIRRSNLATVLQGLGDFEGAKGLMEQALAADLEAFGPDHPEVAIGRSNLATVLQGLGDFEGAKGLMELALAADLEAFGPDHPNVAIRRSNLAGALQGLGDLEGAKGLMELALASALEAFGPGHPNVARERSNLATVLKALGDLEGAKGLMKQALASDLDAFGPDHPSVATRRSNLALVLKALGDLEGAREHAQEARRIVALMPEGAAIRVAIENATRALVEPS